MVTNKPAHHPLKTSFWLLRLIFKIIPRLIIIGLIIQIIVIDKGKVVEEGSHEQLIRKKGFYAKSFHLQAQGYSQNIVK